jgi:hypothetical protein
LQVLWKGISGHSCKWELVSPYVEKQQRPSCLPFGLLVAAVEAKKAAKRAARRDPLAAHASPVVTAMKTS